MTRTYFYGFSSPTFLSAEAEKERLCPCGKQLDEGCHHVQFFAKHARGVWLVGHNAVQAVWLQAGDGADSTAQVDVAHGLPRELTPQVGSATFSSPQITKIFGG